MFNYVKFVAILKKSPKLGDKMEEVASGEFLLLMKFRSLLKNNFTNFDPQNDNLHRELFDATGLDLENYI